MKKKQLQHEVVNINIVRFKVEDLLQLTLSVGN